MIGDIKFKIHGEIIMQKLQVFPPPPKKNKYKIGPISSKPMAKRFATPVFFFVPDSPDHHFTPIIFQFIYEGENQGRSENG